MGAKLCSVGWGGIQAELNLGEGRIRHAQAKITTNGEAINGAFLVSLAEMASFTVMWMASRSRVDEARGPAAGSAAEGAAIGTRGVSSTSAPMSPRTCSNIFVVFDFLPSCMPLPLGAVNSRWSAMWNHKSCRSCRHTWTCSSPPRRSRMSERWLVGSVECRSGRLAFGAGRQRGLSSLTPCVASRAA